MKKAATNRQQLFLFLHDFITKAPSSILRQNFTTKRFLSISLKNFLRSILEI